MNGTRLIVALAWLVFHAGAVPAAAAEGRGSQPPTAAAVAKKLAAMLDLGTPGLERVARAAKAGDADGVLVAYRDHLVAKLRRMDLGDFGWHESYQWQMDAAKVLVGKVPAGTTGVEGIPGMSGPPGTSRRIDWLANVGKESQADYSWFKFLVVLPAAYRDTGDAVYLEKGMEVMADFACNQKAAVAQTKLDLTNYNASWSTAGRDAGAALAATWRVDNTIKCLAAFSKCLPADQERPTWTDVLRPSEGPASAEGVALMPPPAVAEVAISLVTDHAQMLQPHYLPNGKLPNQRMHGLSSLLLVSRVFSEFRESKPLAAKVSAALADYAQTIYYADGGNLEQSFNYNLGDLTKYREAAALFDESEPAMLRSWGDKVRLFERMIRALRPPGGGTPCVGNMSTMNPPAIWQGNEVRRKWEEDLRSYAAKSVGMAEHWIPVTEAFDGFTSVSFPYSGYHVMRRDWGMESPYLFFMTARPANGHCQRDRCGIQVAAHGRWLLVSAGGSLYGGGEPGLREYLNEDSAFKANTVIVNGGAQNNAPQASVASEQPIRYRWHTSDDFDFVEGVHDLGYGGKPADVAHKRSIVFVRRPGLWIVTDLLLNVGTTARPQGGGGAAAAGAQPPRPTENEYTQLWHFPPPAATGFTAEQVFVDEKTRRIHTADADGPNVWLYQFSPQPLTYAKYFGSRSPAPVAGWFKANGMIPAPEVRVRWKQDGGANIVVTVIAPSPGAEEAITGIDDVQSRTKGSLTAFSLTTRDGSFVTHRTWAVPPRQGSAPGDALTGDGCETTCEAGGRTCLLNVNPKEGHEVVQEANGQERKVVVSAPSGFRWAETKKGAVPVYDGKK